MTTATASPTWQALPLASAGCGAIFIGEPSLEWIIQPQMRLPILSSASSAPLSTASTPGRAAAALLSMPRIVACACGERTNTAKTCPGRFTSAVKWPRPVMKRWSSLRRTAAPTPVALMAPLLGRRRPLLSPAVAHSLGAGRDRLHDVVVAGAAADVAFELMADGLLIELVALAVHDVDRRHDHARRAVAALQPMMLAERFLHRMQRPVLLRQPLDGGDVGALDLPREHGARLHRLAVDMHDAGTALRGVATHMGAGEPQVLAQELHQQRARIDVTGDGLAVHRQSDGGHERPPEESGQTPCFGAAGEAPAADGAKIGSILPGFPPWNKFTSGPVRRRRSRGQAAAHGQLIGLSCRLRRHGGGEALEEIVRRLLGRAVDQALAELGQLAADLRLDVVGEQRTAILVGQRHLGIALGEAGHTALAFAGDAVAAGRIEVEEPHLSLPTRLDRADLEAGDGLEFGVRVLVELLAAGDAVLEHLRVVEHRPDLVAAGRKLDLPGHRHRHRRTLHCCDAGLRREAAARKAPRGNAAAAILGGWRRRWAPVNVSPRGSHLPTGISTSAPPRHGRAGFYLPMTNPLVPSSLLTPLISTATMRGIVGDR